MATPWHHVQGVHKDPTQHSRYRCLPRGRPAAKHCVWNGLLETGRGPTRPRPNVLATPCIYAFHSAEECQYCTRGQKDTHAASSSHADGVTPFSEDTNHAGGPPPTYGPAAADPPTRACGRTHNARVLADRNFGTPM